MEVVFSKVLSPTDTTDRLAMPMKAYRHFFPGGEHDNYVHFKVTDSDQNCYTFRLAKRNRGKYPKPHITGAWLAFVANKGVRAGHKVTLYLQQDGADAHYTIEVMEKRIKLFGNDIWEAY